ncbi:MAG TPA: Type 1 glutamine amidotransferase-like domain-containing protein [Candidatus Saccharimonadales bacterium]|nr:Type 1 glutamine amidotransferase-like domain-containing protein [Candidatus Saccharimonadales bacterium]
MILLLTANGLTPAIVQAFKQVYKKPFEQSSVGFITTAAFGEEDGPEWNAIAWLEKHREKLREQKITDIEDINLKEVNQYELEEKLLSKDIIYINGGNTFYLLYWVRKRKLENLLRIFLQRGGIYIGVSAGSIITCPTIESAGWDPADKNAVNLTNLKGLNLVNFLIHPHFENIQKKQMQNIARGTKYPIVALTNQQAILVHDKSIQLIGEKTSNFFNEFTER